VFEALAMLMILVLLVLLVVYASRTSALERKLSSIDRHVSTMQSDLFIMEKELKALIHAGGSSAEAAPPVATGPPVDVPTPTGPEPEQRQPSEARVADRSPVMPPKPAKAPARSKQEWEMLIGGKLLNRIGAFALILAVGFFFKYAVDRHWINEAVRVSVGGAFGFLLIGGGIWFERRKLQVFAQGLIGAGVAILYLSVYATFNFYHLVPQLAAFALMSVVTALTLLLAIRYDSLAVSLLGWAGGFLTPLMLSTGETNAIGLFTYIALLDAGLLLLIVQKEKWILLQPLTLVATYALYFAWYSTSYTHAQLGVAAVFLTLFWLLFFLAELPRVANPLTRFMAAHETLAGANLLMFAAVLRALLDKEPAAIPASALFAIGALYFGLFVSTRQKPRTSPLSTGRFLLSAHLMLVWASGVAFERYVLVAVWSAEATVLTWSGMRWKDAIQRWSGIAIHVLSVLLLLGTDGSFGASEIAGYSFLLSLRSFGFLVCIAALAMSALWHERLDVKERIWAQPLHYAWIVLALLLLATETDDLFRSWIAGAMLPDVEHLQFLSLMTVAGVWSVYAAGLVWSGLRSRRTPLLYAGLGVLFLALALGVIRGLAYTPITLFTPVLNMRAAVEAGFMLLLLVLFRLVVARKADAAWYGELLHVLRVAGALLLLAVCTAECRDSFLLAMDHAGRTRAGDEAMFNLSNMMQLSLSGVWLLYSIGLMVVGLRMRNRILRVLSILLFGISILKIFIYDLSYLDTLYRIFSFVALGLILLIVSYLYQRFKDVVFADGTGETAVASETPGADETISPPAGGA
jgi:uncharacterized membrane protein